MWQFSCSLMLLTLASVQRGGVCLEREEDPSTLVFANEISGLGQRQAARRQRLDEGPSRPGTIAANDYVDDVLRNLPKLQDIINPARIGDLQRGGVYLSNITLTGIKETYRHGNAKLNITDDILRVVTRLGSPQLVFDALYTYKMPWFLPNVSGEVEFALNRIVILFDLRMSPNGVELMELKVDDVHSLTVNKLTGARPFNWLLRFVVEVVVRRNQPRLVKALEAQTRSYITKALEVTAGAAEALEAIDQEIAESRREQEFIDRTENS